MDGDSYCPLNKVRVKLKIQFLLSVCLLATLPAFAQKAIHHIEPPHWWVGMHNEHLQLLIHGDQIAGLQPSVDYPGVRVVKSTTTSNANYLFLELEISPQTQPGSIEIVFRENAGKVFSVDYTLYQREWNAESNPGFDASDVIYLITPDRFANGDNSNDKVDGMLESPNRTEIHGRHGGDLQGIINNLDYIHNLGFTALWLNPVLENNMPSWSYHGYAITDFYQVDPRFGTNQLYRELADSLRKKNMKLIMDQVLNHCGSAHWWMDDSPSEDWINRWPEYRETNHRRTTWQDIHASEADRREFASGWFVPAMPDLNQRNRFMARYLIQNSIWWVEYLGLSGIRVDTWSYPDKYFASEWAAALTAEYPNLSIVGEEWFLEPAILAYWQAGQKNHDGYSAPLKSLMDFPLQDALVRALTHDEGWNSGWIELYETLALDFLYPNPDDLVIFPDNHDMSRIATQLDHNPDLVRMALAFFLTTRGIPQIYYGTEIGMANPDSDAHGVIRSDFPGGWPQDSTDAFSGKNILPEQHQLLEYTQKLLGWRKSNAAVHKGRMVHFYPQNGVYTYWRIHNDSKVLVAFNKNDSPVQLDVTRFGEVLDGESRVKDAISGAEKRLGESLEIPPRAAIIFEVY